MANLNISRLLLSIFASVYAKIAVLVVHKPLMLLLFYGFPSKAEDGKLFSDHITMK